MVQESRPPSAVLEWVPELLKIIGGLAVGFVLGSLKDRSARKRDERDAMSQWAGAASIHMEAMQQQLRVLIDQEIDAEARRPSRINEAEAATVERRTSESKQQLHLAEAMAVGRARTAKLRKQVLRLSDKARFEPVDQPQDGVARIARLEVVTGEYELACASVREEVRSLLAEIS